MPLLPQFQHRVHIQNFFDKCSFQFHPLKKLGYTLRSLCPGSPLNWGSFSLKTRLYRATNCSLLSLPSLLILSKFLETKAKEEFRKVDVNQKSFQSTRHYNRNTGKFYQCWKNSKWYRVLLYFLLYVVASVNTSPVWNHFLSWLSCSIVINTIKIYHELIHSLSTDTMLVQTITVSKRTITKACFPYYTSTNQPFAQSNFLSMEIICNLSV